MEIEKAIISSIVDMIEAYSQEFCTHPNDAAKIFAASMLVDHEIMRRMTIINEKDEMNERIFVGHCSRSSNITP